jgi:hypothetical protein
LYIQVIDIELWTLQIWDVCEGQLPIIGDLDENDVQSDILTCWALILWTASPASENTPSECSNRECTAPG